MSAKYDNSERETAKPVSISLRPSQLERLNHLARLYGISKSQLLRTLIDEKFESVSNRPQPLKLPGNL